MNNNKTYIVTGATSGIGFESALEIAKTESNLILVGRNYEKGQHTKKIITEQTNNKNIEFYLTDLSSQKEIHLLSNKIKNNYSKIDVLINNAGAIFPKRIETIDGIEMTFALNHLNYFLLTNLLLELIKKSKSGRIINVSSDAHRASTLDFNDIQSKINYDGYKTYCKSKEANVLFTYYLADLLKNSTITVNALHPGLVNSNFANNLVESNKDILSYFKTNGLSPKQGSETSVYLALSENVQTVTGKYFDKKATVSSKKESYDKNRQSTLWEISKIITKL